MRVNALVHYNAVPRLCAGRVVLPSKTCSQATRTFQNLSSTRSGPTAHASQHTNDSSNTLKRGAAQLPGLSANRPSRGATGQLGAGTPLHECAQGEGPWAKGV